MILRGRGGLVVRHRSRKAPGSKPASTEDPPCIGAAARQIMRREPNVLPPVRCLSLERRLPPTDLGSKLRGPSQNSPRVASKRDVNITKLN
ncbi:hypothetical protein AVEN_111877-1 [Araneus ventricosus]|uniref:Uncharacterized protein n=1 Tax=Araneus ventricosus TaxID=182803 RepID=A0A4Y2BXF4_ARAVE|nr:hypothetical protein AVEN_111877-1 [Araneus ventricosus]